jgi:hypothetical protein
MTMARKKQQRHEPPITVKEAIERYQRPRWWFNYYRLSFTPIDPQVADLSRRYTYLYEDEIKDLIQKRPYQPRKATHAAMAA